MQGGIDTFLAAAAVGGDRAGRAPGSRLDPPDRRRQLRGGGRVTHLDGVVEPDPVVIVGELGLVAEFDRLTGAAFGDRAGIAVPQVVMQAQSGRSRIGMPSLGTGIPP